MDLKILDDAIEFASGAAKKASDYKAETYFAVLVSALLRQTSFDKPGAQSPLEPPVAPGTRSDGSSQKQYSAGELFATRVWETEIEKVTLSGYFLERYSNLPSYSIHEIRNCLISAKVALPANVNLAVLKAVQKGWMMEVPGQGEKHKVWALTQTGERKIAEMTARVDN